MNDTIRTGTLIALTAASLFAAACSKKDAASSAAPSGEKTAMVHCMGVNECKGHGGCKGEKNACAGQNGCKGQGFVETTAADCQTKGGTAMAAK
jgi:hypothetical protein